MDDLKLIGKNEGLKDEIRIAKTFSKDIKMEFGLKNCQNFVKKVKSKERNTYKTQQRMKLKS
jgi:hypothetical protein